MVASHLMSIHNRASLLLVLACPTFGLQKWEATRWIGEKRTVLILRGISGVESEGHLLWALCKGGAWLPCATYTSSPKGGAFTAAASRYPFLLLSGIPSRESTGDETGHKATSTSSSSENLEVTSQRHMTTMPWGLGIPYLQGIIWKGL